MSTQTDDLKGALLSAADAYANAVAADAVAAQVTTDQAAIAALNTTITGLREGIALDLADITQLNAQIAALQQAQTPSPATSPFDGPGFGVYTGGDSYPVTAVSGWKVQPNVGSFYENWGEYNATTGKVTLSPGLVAAAKDPHVLFLQIAYNTGQKETYANISAGKDAALLKALCAALDALGKPWLLAINNEADTSTNYPSGQTPAQYGAAVNYVAQNFVSKSKFGGMLAWLAAYEDAATLESFITVLDQSVVEDLSGDPYDTGTHPAGETFQQTCQSFVTAAKAAGWKGRLHISETGIVVDKGNKTEAQLEAWVASIPAGAAALGLSSITFFDDNSGGKDYVPTNPALLAAYGVAAQKFMATTVAA